MDNLSKRAVLVSLEINHWSGRCVDKKVSDEVLTSNNADSDSGSFSKRLIAKEYLSEISKINNEARKYFKENTMAWESGKRRLLPSKKITEFTDFMRNLEDKHAEACQVFVDNYNTYMNDAQAFLNGLYNPADYPPQDEIAEKFGLKYEFTNIDSPNDFRCEVSEEVKNEIQERMKASLEKKFNGSMQNLYKKIYELLRKFGDRLSNEDAQFKKGLFENIEDLVRILPNMNIMDDPKLAEITERIQNDICRFDVEQLRHDKVARKEAVQASQSIIETMGELYA